MTALLVGYTTLLICFYVYMHFYIKAQQKVVFSSKNSSYRRNRLILIASVICFTQFLYTLYILAQKFGFPDRYLLYYNAAK